MLPMRLGMLNAPPNKPQDLIVYVLTKNMVAPEQQLPHRRRLAANENLPRSSSPSSRGVLGPCTDTSTARRDYKLVFTSISGT